MITAIQFSPNGQSLISVGGDGCIMVWRLSEDLVKAMQDRLVELYANAKKKQQIIAEKQAALLAEEVIENKKGISVRTGSGLNSITSDIPPSDPDNNSEDIVSSVSKVEPLKLHASQLPAWAKGKEESISSSSRPSNQVRGSNSKWLPRGSEPVLNRERHKLTLEVTSALDEQDEESENNQGTTSRRAQTMESSDEVVIQQENQDISYGDFSSDEEDDDEFEKQILVNSSSEEKVSMESLSQNVNEDINTTHLKNVDEGEDILDKTCHDLDELMKSANNLESWLEKKVI